MKSLILVITLLVSSLTFASGNKTVSCFNPEIQDATFSVAFKLVGSDLGPIYSVKLRVPKGETEAKVYDGLCSRAGAVATDKNRPYLTCTVMTSSDSGYSVKLYTKGISVAGYATVKKLRTRGSSESGKTISLPKCVVE